MEDLTENLTSPTPKKSKTAIIIPTLIIIVLVSAAYYLLSDTFKTKQEQPTTEQTTSNAPLYSDEIPMDHQPGILYVHFNEGITPEQAKEIAEKYNGKIQEQKSIEQEYDDNGEIINTREIVSPWEYWKADRGNSATIRFEGANDSKLLESINTLQKDENITSATPNYISYPN